jgi:hypothetical protein
MAITKYAGDRYVGLSSDTKPTNVLDGAVFFETDTKKIYLKGSGTWSEVDYNNYTDAEAVSAIKADADWKATNWDTAYGWGNHSTAGYVLPVLFEDNDLSVGTETIDSIDITTSGTFSWYFQMTNSGKLYAGEIIGSVLPVTDGYGATTYYTNKALGVYSIGAFDTPSFTLEYNTGTNKLDLKVTVSDMGWEIKGKRFEVARI